MPAAELVTPNSKSENAGCKGLNLGFRVSDFGFIMQCPKCQSPIRLPSTGAIDKKFSCPTCHTVFAIPEDHFDAADKMLPRRGARPLRRKKKSAARLWIGLGAGCGVTLLAVVGGCIGLVYWFLSPTSFPDQTEDYAQARKTYETRLTRQGPAPQAWQRARPGEDVEEVEYQSGNLRLKAWVSSADDVNKKHSAVLFLHGGFAFGEDDWEQAEPFEDAGFVVMIPMLRGENGLPGAYSMFYHEVDDVLAAADVLAQRPDVDPDQIFVAGHSVGGTLALLASMTSSRFRAAASFSGSPDQVAWSRMQPQVVPFDRNDNREYQMRSPLAFPASFKCPVRIYYGSQEILFIRSSQKLAKQAKKHNLDVETVSVPGDHMSSVDAAMQQAIAFFRSQERRKR
jgi:dienelactone hydrolase